MCNEDATDGRHWDDGDCYYADCIERADLYECSHCGMPNPKADMTKHRGAYVCDGCVDELKNTN